MKKLKLRRRYVAELNRCIGDNVARAIGFLERRGYYVERVPHLTTVKITPPRGHTFAELKTDLRQVLQPRRGSLVVASSSGRAWFCNLRGNRPGVFVRIL